MARPTATFRAYFDPTLSLVALHHVRRRDDVIAGHPQEPSGSQGHSSSLNWVNSLEGVI